LRDTTAEGPVLLLDLNEVDEHAFVLAITGGLPVVSVSLEGIERIMV
jgi:hypothetical protein